VSLLLLFRNRNGTPAPEIIVADRPTGGWDTGRVESAAEREARVRRERQQLGIIPPDPIKVEIAGEATHTGPAPQRAEPVTEAPPIEAVAPDYSDVLTGSALAIAMREAEDDAIAILLLMAA